MMSKTQKAAILEYCKKHKKGITTWTAFELGVTCLWKRISELEQDGHHFNRETIEGTNRYGNPCRVVRYSISYK